MKSPKVKLTPPDPKQCQAKIRSGCFPTGMEFMIMGPGLVERCPNVPKVIVYENHPGKDGQKGSMSLCLGCLKKFRSEFPLGHARIEQIKNQNAKRK